MCGSAQALDDLYDRVWKRIRARHKICIKTGRDYRERPVTPRPLDLVEYPL